MWPDNDNMPPRDYFMPKLGPWRWVGLALAFSVPILFLAALSESARKIGDMDEQTTSARKGMPDGKPLATQLLTIEMGART